MFALFILKLVERMIWEFRPILPLSTMRPQSASRDLHLAKSGRFLSPLTSPFKSVGMLLFSLWVFTNSICLFMSPHKLRLSPYKFLMRPYKLHLSPYESSQITLVSLQVLSVSSCVLTNSISFLMRPYKLHLSPYASLQIPPVCLFLTSSVRSLTSPYEFHPRVCEIRLFSAHSGFSSKVGENLKIWNGSRF